MFNKIESPVVEAPVEKKEVEPNYIGIEDFAKVELRVGAIIACEPVTESEKLLKMQVDFGPLGVRQILGGVKKFFAPEDLLNKQGVFVFNLKPRKLLGMESNGMMLTADDGNGGLKRVTIEGLVPAGTLLK